MNHLFVFLPSLFIIASAIVFADEAFGKELELDGLMKVRPSSQ